MDMERKENGLVDIVKFICAIIVVAGHCYLADVDGMSWYTDLVKLAVQIFFIFSGYFLVTAGTLQQEKRATSYVRHLFGMTLIWAVVYFAVNLLVTDRSSDVWVYDFIKLWTEFFTSFNSGHLWYLQNLLLVVVLLLGLKKTEFSGKEVLFWLVLSSVFYGRITRAVLGIAVGIYLASEEAKDEKKQSGSRLLIGMGTVAIVGGLLGLLAGNAAISEIMRNYIGNILAILIAFCALYGRLPGEEKMNFVYLRKQSTLVYLVHLVFVPFVVKLMSSVFAAWLPVKEKGMAWCLLLTAAVVLCSLLFGGVVIVLSKREKFCWLKKLY